jgi:tRNA-specific 2-thiouridylase
MTVALAFSGGVDSTVSALLLKEKGYQVTAIYIRFWARDQKEKNRILDEEEQARKIANSLNINFQSLDFSQKHKEEVVDYFIRSYENGNSPNPCINCNYQLKFGLFFDWAMENNFDLVASGHYAQIKKINNHFYLERGEDLRKDQSYFLYKLTENKLAKILFPIGHLEKTEVRAIAEKNNLQVAQKKDSFDLCFLNETTTQEFIDQHLGKKEGEIIDQEGNTIGKHQGIWFYTIGQRQGLEVNHQQLKKFHPEMNKEQLPPLFVIAKNKEKNQLIVGPKEACFRKQFSVKEINIINPRLEKIINKGINLEVKVKIRNTGRLVEAEIQKIGQEIQVNSKEKIFALAAGQSAVFYKNRSTIGGGIIKG